MKKTLLALGVALFLATTPVMAQEVNLTPEARATLIAELKTQLNVLLVQLIQQLQTQLEAKIAENKGILEEVKTEQNEIKKTVQKIETATTPKPNPEPPTPAPLPELRISNVNNYVTNSYCLNKKSDFNGRDLTIGSFSVFDKDNTIPEGKIKEIEYSLEMSDVSENDYGADVSGGDAHLLFQTIKGAKTVLLPEAESQNSISFRETPMNDLFTFSIKNYLTYGTLNGDPIPKGKPTTIDLTINSIELEDGRMIKGLPITFDHKEVKNCE